MKKIFISNVLITEDEQANAAYIYLKPELRGKKGCVVRTYTFSGFNIDLDENEEVIGIEIV